MTLAVSPEGGETATIDGGGTSGLYLAGTAIAVTAATSQDYEFVNWTVGGTEVSAQASFNYIPCRRLKQPCCLTSSPLEL